MVQFGRGRKGKRGVIALATVFVMLFSIADVFFCGLETTSSGMAIALHADEHGDVHAHLGHADSHDLHAGDIIPADRDGHHESGEAGHQDCIHGHCHHGASLVTAHAGMGDVPSTEMRVGFQPVLHTSAILSGIERPPRV